MEKIPTKYIIELGLIRKKDKCAKCGKKMDIKDYHIQLCKSCRGTELEKYTDEVFNKDLRFFNQKFKPKSSIQKALLKRTKEIEKEIIEDKTLKQKEREG